MAVGEQDRGGVPVAPTVAFRRLDQPVDFTLGQVLRGRSDLTVTFTAFSPSGPRCLRPFGRDLRIGRDPRGDGWCC